MTGTRPGWEVYERMIARLIADQSATHLCVSPNAKIVGKISRRSRQIDVLIEKRHNTDNSLRVIVDAKKKRRRVGIEDVEAFLGLMQDVGATHGYLVSPAGHTKAAEKRAQSAVGLRIVPLNRLANFDPSTWPACRAAGCKTGRIFWDGYPELSARAYSLDGARPVFRILRFIHYVGKCDRCGLFHVRCETCGDTLAVPHDGRDDDCGHACGCRLPWFWIGSIESDGEGAPSAELRAVWGIDKMMTVDRRSL